MSHPPFAVQPRRFTRSFHVSAKPIGSQCNLDCTYCYYLHKHDLLPDATGSQISDELLEEFIRQYIASQDFLGSDAANQPDSTADSATERRTGNPGRNNSVVFTWHGGEPALLGLDFFRKVVRLQQKYAGTKRIRNDLQTNGLLIDDAWCEFLKEHRFLVGLSIDGPKHLHDLFRVSKCGASSFDQVCRAARLLQRYDVSFNTMTVINAVNAQHPAEVYRFLTEELGSRRLQWLACVEPKDFCTTAPGHWDAARMPILGANATKPGHPDSVVTDWSVDSDVWGEFLCQTFDLWRTNGLGTVQVNWFESLVSP